MTFRRSREMSSKLHPVIPVIWLAGLQEKREVLMPIRCGAGYRYRSAANAPRFNAAVLSDDISVRHPSWLTQLSQRLAGRFLAAGAMRKALSGGGHY